VEIRTKQERNAKVIIAGHAFVQNVRRGHYELFDEPASRRLAVAFEELVLAIWSRFQSGSDMPAG